MLTLCIVVRHSCVIEVWADRFAVGDDAIRPSFVLPRTEIGLKFFKVTSFLIHFVLMSYPAVGLYSPVQTSTVP